MLFPKSKGDALHRNRKAWQRETYPFFLVLIQERTKENQGWKARPDGCPVCGTAARYYSPRLRHGSCGIAYKVHRHVPPPTHCRVRLLCHCLHLPLHSLSGKRAGLRSFSIFNLDDPSQSSLRGETLALQLGLLIASPLSCQERGGGEVVFHEQRTTSNYHLPLAFKHFL